MTKAEAIRQVTALNIPFINLVDGQCSPEATRRSMSEDHFACMTPRCGGELLVVSTDARTIDTFGSGTFTCP